MVINYTKIGIGKVKAKLREVNHNGRKCPVGGDRRGGGRH